MKKVLGITLILASFISLALINPKLQDKKEDKKKSPKVKNVIILIGDGMGLSQMSSAYYYGKDEPNFSRFKVVGLSRTSSGSHKITDSAAGATAISAGKKTYNGAIGVDMDTNAVETLVEYVSKKDYNTAVISTSSITHATPASFYAHVNSRNKAHKIAAQMAKSPIDFFAGGGREYFIDEEENPGLLKKLEKKDFVLNMESLIAADELKKKKKYGFLLAKDGMPKMTEGRGKFLLDASSLALEYLNKRKDPFFMMIEGSQIDWGGHANDAEYVISETLDFDQTIGAVLDFAEKDGNTLVIVTADHETGGFTLAAEEKKVPFQGTQRDYNSIAPSFSTGGHSSAMVPVLAFGPGAENFQGIYQNTEIHAKIKELLK
jgi:alkaline phosphatase